MQRKVRKHDPYFTWRGRKYSGSAVEYQKKMKKQVKNHGISTIDSSLLEGNILYGWYFDCCCGKSGSNYDDGKRMLQCDICKVWKHCSCNGIPTNKSKLFLRFISRAVWVCNDCNKGIFKYRAKHWQIPLEIAKSDGELLKVKKSFSDGNNKKSESEEDKEESIEELKIEIKEKKKKKVSFSDDIIKVNSSHIEIKHNHSKDIEPEHPVIKGIPTKFTDGIKLPVPSDFETPVFKRSKSISHIVRRKILEM